MRVSCVFCNVVWKNAHYKDNDGHEPMSWRRWTGAKWQTNKSHEGKQQQSKKQQKGEGSPNYVHHQRRMWLKKDELGLQ